MYLKEQLNRKEHKERKGVQCLASMTLFTPGVNVVRIAVACFCFVSFAPLRFQMPDLV
jgi:hypothetical protein